MPQLSSTEGPLERTSWRLLSRVRLGDAEALAQLVARYLPRLSRWTHGRLPRWIRADVDTADLVQDVMLRSIGRLDAVELRAQRALRAYFREAVRNRIRDEHRRFARWGMSPIVADTLVDPAGSPLDSAIKTEQRARYRAALADLDPADRELIVGHVDLDYTHEQLGCMTGRTPNAARMALQRAIGRLAVRMRAD